MNVPKLRFKEFNDEWTEATLGKFTNVLMCKRIFANQTSESYEVPFYKIGTIGSTPDTYISRELFEEYRTKYNYPKKSEILITCSGTVGKCIVFNGEDAYFQDSNIVWIDNPNNVVNNIFLYYILSNVDWSRLNSTTIVRIYGDNLRQLKIKYPTEKEQSKIINTLSLLDKKIELQSKKIEALKLFKKGLIHQMKKSSNDWVEYKVSEIFKITRGIVIPKTDLSENKINKYIYPVYSSQTSNNGILGYDGKFDFDGKYLTWTTDGANAGKVFFRNGKFRCTNVCGVLYNDSNNYVNELTADLLNYETPKHVSYTGNPKLMNNIMGDIKVFLPDIDESDRVSNILLTINNKFLLEKNKLSKLNELKNGLIQCMFI